MKLTGKTQTQIDAEETIKSNKILADAAQAEVEAELQDILRSIAINKYIEKQKA